ncbi:MAG: MBL fold metallo-hydrolase [Deltaproteobacteria bacterium]|nr:MBL fold metallo-hydrolase [Deltaproteobacteria bacterium]
MNFSLIVNGAGNAFLREFGCPCSRCTGRENRATASVSIVARDEKDDKILWHALVDAGPGVVESLVNGFPPEKDRLDWLLLTHWHPDHTLDLNHLCETARSTGRKG